MQGRETTLNPRHGPPMANSQDPAQQIGEAIQYGVVASVDCANATCTVTLGDLTTEDLPHHMERGPLHMPAQAAMKHSRHGRRHGA